MQSSIQSLKGKSYDWEKNYIELNPNWTELKSFILLCVCINFHANATLLMFYKDLYETHK